MIFIETTDLSKVGLKEPPSRKVEAWQAPSKVVLRQGLSICLSVELLTLRGISDSNDGFLIMTCYTCAQGILCSKELGLITGKLSYVIT